MIEIIPFTDEKTWLEKRVQDITSTEISCLFGISPYSTPFELWHRKHDKTYVKIDPNERMKAGTHYQNAIAKWFSIENNWIIRRKDEYVRNTELRIGASFDFSIKEKSSKDTYEIQEDTGMPIPSPRYVETGLLEIKNVDGLVFKNDWTIKEDGLVEAPLHIEIQVQHQLLVSGASVCYIGVLVGGNTHYLIKRTPDQRVHEAIKQKVAEFWHSVDNNIEPKPDFNQDAEFIKTLYGYAEPGTVLDISSENNIKEIALEYKALGDVVKQADDRRDAIKAEILTKIGTAEKCLGDGFSISTVMVGPAHIEYDRAPYRSFKITFKKQK